MRNNIKIYEVKSEYIKYLSNYQKHIFTQTEGKDKRKLLPVPDSQIVDIDINKEKMQVTGTYCYALLRIILYS